MSNKRYYWLKLNEDFFEEDTITFIEEQENGKDYVIFYLKLLLKSVKEEGTLVRYVGERLMPYDTNSLAKLTNTPVDTVRVAMELFAHFGLVKKLDAGELYLTQIDEMIGTETESARRVRKHRAIKNANENIPLLQCNGDVIKSNIEIERELEKELDIEKENELSELENRFNEFWELYPRKENKKKALSYYKKINEETHDIIMNDLKVRVNSKDWKKDKGKYVMLPTTYLNGERWNDEIVGVVKSENIPDFLKPL